MRKIAIFGSRGFKKLDLVCDLVSLLEPGIVVVTGGAEGVDRIAEDRARARGLDVIVVRPDWKTHGKAAGPIRNAEIVKQADEVHAFWDGSSRGTKSSIDLATRAGKKLRIVREDGTEEWSGPT